MSSLKEHAKSFVITFIAAFAVAVLANWDKQSWSHDTYFALFSAGVRAGAKAVLEMLAIIRPTATVSKPPAQQDNL